MANTLTVIVAAVPSLVDALRTTGQFAAVIDVPSTSGLRDLLGSGRLSNTPKDKVFIFAEDTPVDTPLTLPALISKLVSMGSPVIVLGKTMAGRALVQECPGAGLLEGPLLLNQVLGAISGYPGVPTLSPVSNNVPIDLSGTSGVTQAPFNQQPVQTPASPVPAGSPFGAAQPSFPEPNSGSAGSPFGQGPGTPGNDSGGQAVENANPFGGAQNTSPFGGTPDASPFGSAQDAGSPFGGGQAAPFNEAPQSSPDPFGNSPAASPFGNAPTSAPAESTPPVSSPFGSSSGAGQDPFGNSGGNGNNPFGSSEQSSPASPFGSPNAAASSPFGEAQSTDPFASANQTTPQQEQPQSPGGGSPFGGDTASPFGAETPSNPFGADTPSPFDSNPAPASSAFGNAPADTGQSPFGAAASQGDPFGGGQPFLAVDTVEQEPPYGAPKPRQGTGGAPETQRRGFVITVATPKGGTGKSSMSLNLAAYLGLRLRLTGRNVCMIDANVGQADTGKYLNVWTPNVEDILRDPGAIHPDRIQNHLAHFPHLNMSALLGPIQPEAANPLLFTGEKYTEILNAIKPHYDYIIIDTPEARFHSSMLRDFALPNADFVVVVVTPNNITLMNTELWLSAITDPTSGNSLDRDRVGIVLNRAEDDIGVDEEEVRRELGEWRFLGAVPETKEWKRANNANRLVATSNYHELNQAFSVVLQAATGEDLISPGSAIEPVKTGLLDRFGRLLRRGDRK